MSSVFCKNCGKEIPSDAKKCPFCKSKVLKEKKGGNSNKLNKKTIIWQCY